MMIGAAVAFTGLFLALRPRISISPADWGVLAALSVLVLVNYLSFYKALELGPLAIVTPVVTAYAAIVIIASVVLLNERLDPIQAAAISVTIGGVVLASADLRRLQPGAARIGRGVWFGLFSMIGFGISVFVGGLYARKYGWFLPAYLVRVFVAVLLTAIAAGRREWPWQRLGAGTLAFVFVMGALESGGFFWFARGAELGFISIVAAASAVYPIIPLVLGLALFRERPAPNQMAGILAVIAGVFVLGLQG
jgi:drug/metabolite transporter (DMT)-like permease